MSVAVEVSRKYETYVRLDTKKDPSIQIGQRIYDRCQKTIANLIESFGNEAFLSSTSRYDINEDLTVQN
jgi:hypothetical protein